MEVERETTRSKKKLDVFFLSLIAFHKKQNLTLMSPVGGKGASTTFSGASDEDEREEEEEEEEDAAGEDEEETAEVSMPFAFAGVVGDGARRRRRDAATLGGALLVPATLPEPGRGATTVLAEQRMGTRERESRARERERERKKKRRIVSSWKNETPPTSAKKTFFVFLVCNGVTV